MTPTDRLLGKVVKTTDCWLWTGAVSSNGYGSVQYEGHRTTAHRAAYELLVGSVPDGLTLDHLCRNKLCVKPDHLEPVTRAENNRRARIILTHCKRGHPLSGDNLRLRGNRRQCRACEPLYACNQKAAS